MDNKTTAFITAAVSFTFWGTLVIYWHGLANVNPLEVVSHRAIWSLIFTGILIVALRRTGEVVSVLKNPKYILPLICSSLLIAGNWGVFIWSVANEKIIESTMGNYVTPLLNVTASALIFKVKLNKYQVLSVLLALIGVVYMVIVYGAVPYVAIFFAVTFCAYGIIKKLVQASALTGLFVETLFISIPCAIYVIYLLVSGKSAILEGNTLVTTLLICGGIVTTLPLLGFSFSAKYLHLSTLGLLQYLNPTIAFLIGVFVYHEYFSRNMLITFMFIWAGLLIYSLDGLRQMKHHDKSPKSV